MPCRLVNSHTSEGLATSIVRVVQKEAIFFLAYADVEGKLLGFSNCTRIYTASCPRRLEFYSYYFFVTLGTTSKPHHSSLLYSAEILPSASILPNSASHIRVPAGSHGKTATVTLDNPSLIDFSLVTDILLFS